MLSTISGRKRPKNCIGILYQLLKNRNWEIAPAKIKSRSAKVAEMIRNIQKKVEYIIESSFLSCLFSMNNLTTELLMPNDAVDFSIVEKFLKLPNKAIPEVPRKTETILVEIIPRTKLTPTEIEFSDSILISGFRRKAFNFTDF